MLALQNSCRQLVRLLAVRAEAGEFVKCSDYSDRIINRVMRSVGADDGGCRMSKTSRAHATINLRAIWSIMSQVAREINSMLFIDSIPIANYSS